MHRLRLDFGRFSGRTGTLEGRTGSFTDERAFFGSGTGGRYGKTVRVRVDGTSSGGRYGCAVCELRVVGFQDERALSKDERAVSRTNGHFSVRVRVGGTSRRYGYGWAVWENCLGTGGLFWGQGTGQFFWFRGHSGVGLHIPRQKGLDQLDFAQRSIGFQTQTHLLLSFC